jgi:glycosyltransferase involved in cell wall biosynthesis
MKNTFVISCPIDTYSGYGSRSRDLIKALINLDKYDVKILPQRWGNTPHSFIEDHNEEWGFLTPHLMTGPMTQQPDIWAQITVPNEFQAIGKFNIGITAGIETTICAPQWIEGMNRMNLNLVSSEHSKKVFQDSKFQKQDDKTQQVIGNVELTSPIEVLFEGVDVTKYFQSPLPPTSEIKQALDTIEEDFAFLFVGHWLQGDFGQDRKDVSGLVRVFLETFKNKKIKPALILKTMSGPASITDRDQILKSIDRIKKSSNSKTLPNIYLFHGEISDDEVNQLYNHSKVKAMVSLTKGEGFGRPLLEFTQTKKPIIASNWSGHIDFLNHEFTSLVPGNLTPIHPSAQVKDMLIEGSQWFTADYGFVSGLLKDYVDNYKKYQEKGKRLGFYCKTNFSFEKMQEKLDLILTEKIPEFPKQVQLKLPSLKRIELPKLSKIESQTK